MTRVYNLFRRKGLDALFCAVPEERAVPGFVTARRWEFTGRIDAGGNMPGFDRAAAASAARFTGFYLFPDFRRTGAERFGKARP